MKESRTSWSATAEGVAPLPLVLCSSVGAWFLPEPYWQYVLAILILGLLFDVLSLCCHLATLMTRRYCSGFPLVGLFFYGWFVLAYRRSLLAPHEEGLGRIVLFKLLDLLVLAGLHLPFQLPMLFQGPSERYR